MDPPDSRDRLLAILAADVAGYARLTARDDRAALTALDAGRSVFRDEIAAHGGRVVDMAGDSVLAVFEAATAAVDAARCVQERLAAASNAEVPRSPLRFRIGIHVGDVIVKADGSVYGSGVNIAARLQALAEPGGLAVSAVVKEMVNTRVDANFEDAGEHALKNLELPVRVFLVQPRRSAAEMPYAVPPDSAARKSNLPATPASLFGREADVRAVSALVPAHRIVTVVGTGGIGKTRLACAVAGEMQGTFADGVWLVELASLADPSLLAARIGQSLGLPQQTTKDPREAVIEALKGRSMLLVLDNGEHMTAAVAEFAIALVSASPHVRVLVTSQELLRVPQEQVYPLPALAVPAMAGLAHARESTAVALLVARVQSRSPDFALTDDNADDLSEICRRLDGLPLAIELAAARVPLLGARGVRERLHERLRMLTAGDRGAAPRHQTLRQALEWSCHLLEAAERRLFARLGVFAGGFTIELARQTLTAGGTDDWEVLDLLGSLVDKSLVVPDEGEPRRFRLLESTRALALEHLGAAGEEDALAASHAHALLALFEPSLEDRWTLARDTRMKRYLPEIDNLRAALDWARQADPGLHVALAGASSWIWMAVGSGEEGRTRCAAALDHVTVTTPASQEARLLVGWAFLAERGAADGRAAARRAAIRAVELCQREGNPLWRLEAWKCRAMIAVADGEITEAERATDEMAALIGPGWPVYARWNWLMTRARVVGMNLAGRFEEYAELVDAMKLLADETDHPTIVRGALVAQEQWAQIRGDFGVAVARGRELVALLRQDPFGRLAVGACLGNLSLALTMTGDIEGALAAARESVELGRHAGEIWRLFDGLTLLACRRGRFADAAQLHGHAEAADRAHALRREPTEQRARDEAEQQLRQSLRPEELTTLMAKGAILSEDDALRLALS